MPPNGASWSRRPARTARRSWPMAAASMPMPVSVTASRTVDAARASTGSTSARTTTSPRSVNFTALPTRFIRIWRSAQRIAEQRALRARRRADDELDALVLGRAGKEARALLEHLAEIDRQRLERHFARADLRQIQQVVDDLQQDLRRRADRLREMRLRRRQRRARQQLRHADHAVHRRAQLVAHAIEEVALRRAASASWRLLSVSSRVRSCTSASRRSRALHHLAESSAGAGERGAPRSRAPRARTTAYAHGDAHGAGSRWIVELERLRAPHGVGSSPRALRARGRRDRDS